MVGTLARQNIVDPALFIFAFSAGAAAFFAPCCIAMLPAYVGYAVRAPQEAGTSRASRTGRFLMMGGAVPVMFGALPLIVTGFASIAPIPYQLTRIMPTIDASIALLLGGSIISIAGLAFAGKTRAALRGALFGSLATLGFFATFLAIGLPIALLARSLAAYLPILAVFVGVSLATLGVLMLAGKHIAPRLPTIQADATSPRGYFLFGVAYGVASLSCTFPIFLGVMAAGLVAGGVTSALLVFGAYALGKGVLLVTLTALIVSGGASAQSKLGRAAPVIARAAAVLLILAGAYIAYYYGRFVTLPGGA